MSDADKPMTREAAEQLIRKHFRPEHANANGSAMFCNGCNRVRRCPLTITADRLSWHCEKCGKLIDALFREDQEQR